MVKSIAIATLHQQHMQHGNKSNIPDSRAVCFYLFLPFPNMRNKNQYNRKIIIVTDRCTQKPGR